MQRMDYKDYYATLGISTDADEQTIKTAFRRLARVHHPDVAVEKQGATERFKEINEAYTVLSDPAKRRTYDLFRTRYERYQTGYREPRPQAARTSSGSTPPGASRPSARPSTPPPGASRPSPASSTPPPGTAGSTARPASSATSNASPDSSSDRPGQRRTHTRTINEEDFERIFRGFMWAYTATTARNSDRDGPSASSDFSDFFESLFGNLRNTAGAQSTPERETTEVRPGRDIEVTAQLSLEEAFHGTTRTLTYGDGRKVEVTVPPGVNTGSRLRVRGQGERLMGRPLGDLYMTVDVLPHTIFVREGDDLRIRVSVPYALATKSGEVQIPTLDHPVQLKIPAGARSGQSLRLRGQGMPTVANPNIRGDLIANLEVQSPPNAQARTADAASTGAKATRTSASKTRTHKPASEAARGAGRVRQALGLAVTALSLLLADCAGTHDAVERLALGGCASHDLAGLWLGGALTLGNWHRTSRFGGLHLAVDPGQPHGSRCFAPSLALAASGSRSRIVECPPQVTHLTPCRPQE